ncbi:hypothetical protein Ljor_0124 [Legionella jordanis]|uniref:Uncharacterized protein n=2 Tax=Legionella jordanis TaxID=456 RepID=A0A0W0VFH7_9GAMM|nr:hypothetical protein Ljor_0124 [Legionella jordanis]VEH13001.1 Uncharacterised protein [Legionella jordanis]
MKLQRLMFLSILWFGQSQAMTLPSEPVIPYDCKICEELSHEQLSHSWAIEAKSLKKNESNRQISRKYQKTASLKDLENGVTITTQGPSAVIRISTTAKHNKSPQFFILNSKGEQFSLSEASTLFAKENALSRTAFADELLAFELKPELGAGKFVLKASKGQLQLDSAYQIHVYDRNASTYLTVETNKTRYHYGEQLSVLIRLIDEDLNYPIDDISAYLLSPYGEPISLNLEQIENNLYLAKFDLLSDKDSHGENWYVDVQTTTIVNNTEIIRHGHTAFSYVIPSSAIREIKAKNTYEFSAKLEVATGSRYALEAVLFGRDANGAYQPFAAVQSASWFAAGVHNFDFSFDSNLKSDYKPPYFIGYLRLIDFGQLKPVYEYSEPIAITALG